MGSVVSRMRRPSGNRRRPNRNNNRRRPNRSDNQSDSSTDSGYFADVEDNDELPISDEEERS